MFKEQYPVAWEFHKNSSRSIFQLYDSDISGKIDAPYKEYPSCNSIQLGIPNNIDAGLSQALSNRHSCRDFDNISLQLATLSTLLFHGLGTTGVTVIENQSFLKRTYPSAGGLYPSEFYIIMRHVESINPGIYHYCVGPHILEEVKLINIPDPLITSVFMNQWYLSKASAILVATSFINRTMWKYGDRGYRYMLLELGHTFQNLNLISASLGVSCLNIGGFFDEDLSMLLSIDTNEEIPLYAMAIGAPKV